MNSDQAARLRDWADAYVAGTLHSAERETLERELLTSDEARRFFVSYLELHAGLAWQFRGSDCELPVLREVKPTRASTSRWWRWSLPRAAAMLAVSAAVLAVAAAVWLSLRGAPREPGADSGPVFAVVRETLRGRWADGREARVSESVGRGRWSLQSGLISLQGADGVELLVEGPVTAEWLGAQHIRLMSGTVVVRMPEGGSGFVVETAQMRVTDLGTEFGVSVNPSGDERVQVYGGRVRAETAASGEAQELKAGSALRC